MKKVIAVCGPTAVGKTRMGVSLAEALHGEVISGDSMQIYLQWILEQRKRLLKKCRALSII